MNFSYYSPEELASDPHFRRWVLSPDPAVNYFWEKWLLAHPDKHDIVLEARELVYVLTENERDMQEDQVRLWKRIESTIQTLEEGQVKPGE